MTKSRETNVNIGTPEIAQQNRWFLEMATPPLLDGGAIGGEESRIGKGEETPRGDECGILQRLL